MGKKEVHFSFQHLEYRLNFNVNTKITVVVTFCFLFFSNSCENISGPGQPGIKYSIIFNLTANAEKQKFYIYNVVGLEESVIHFGPLKDYNKFFSENAFIKIESNGNSFSDFIIRRDTNDVEFYTNEDLSPKPGEEYKLEIKIEDNTITGTTVIPEDFQIIAPKDGQVIHHSNNTFNIDLKWERKGNVYGYILDVFYHINEKQALLNYLEYSEIIFDTSYSFMGQILPTDTVKIRLFGFDKNYYEHVFKGKESSGVKGAYGLFGSSVLKTVRVIVR